MSENTQAQLSPQALDAIEKQVKHLLYAVKVAKVTPVKPETLMGLMVELQLAVAAG